MLFDPLISQVQLLLVYLLHYVRQLLIFVIAVQLFVHLEISFVLNGLTLLHEASLLKILTYYLLFRSILLGLDVKALFLERKET